MTRKPKRKIVLTDAIIDLAEIVLKNNIFTFEKKTLNQKQGLLLVPNLHLLIAFYLWQNRKKI